MGPITEIDTDVLRALLQAVDVVLGDSGYDDQAWFIQGAVGERPDPNADELAYCRRLAKMPPARCRSCWKTCSGQVGYLETDGPFRPLCSTCAARRDEIEYRPVHTRRSETGGEQ